MRSIKTSTNPTVLDIKVRYRNSRGKFTKPHLAATIEFTLPKSRKSVVYELPKGRKTKALVLEYSREAIFAEFKEREQKKILAEEKRRQKLPEDTRSDIPDFPKLKLEKTNITLFSRQKNADLRIMGYNYIFAKKVPIDQDNFDVMASYLEEMISSLAIKIFTKEKAWGEQLYAKVFADGYYKRPSKSTSKKTVIDLLGFSISRSEVMNAREIKMYVSTMIEDMSAKFMPSVKAGGFRAGYFSMKFENNQYYITGFRIERVKTLS